VSALSWNEVAAERLASSHLTTRLPAERLLDVVERLCGVQAQVQSAAELSLAARLDGLTVDDVREALWERRQLVRTWTMRGTLHLHTARDLSLWLALRQRILGYPDGDWHTREGIVPEQAQAVLDAVGDALRAGPLLREELAEAVCAQVGEWARAPLMSGWGFLLGPAAYTGRLCHGPPRGSKVTFVRADEWVDEWHEPQADGALAAAARRFLRAYGPASHEAFAIWAGGARFRAGAARTTIEELGDEIVQIEVDGKRLWRLRDAPRVDPAPCVRLVPQYDGYVFGFRERDEFLGSAGRVRIAAHPKGRLEGAVAVSWLLVDGRGAGIWMRERRGRKLELRVEPLRRLTKPQRAELADEAERVGRFLGLDPALSVSG
jgi:hypothetical protein